MHLDLDYKTRVGQAVADLYQNSRVLNSHITNKCLKIMMCDQEKQMSKINYKSDKGNVSR